jgi:excisionase family DNA binding protein
MDVEYLTTIEVAQREHLSRSRIQQLISKGRIPYIKAGNVSLIPENYQIDPPLQNKGLRGYFSGKK